MVDFIENVPTICLERNLQKSAQTNSIHIVCVIIKPEAAKRLLNGKTKVEDLVAEDLELHMEQKGVDMRIGVDISSLAFKGQVKQIILISGDSDFVPAAKQARREGIDFILDPMKAPIKQDLFEHIDGIRTPITNNMLKEKEDA